MAENMMKTPSIIFGTYSQHVCLLVYLRFFFRPTNHVHTRGPKTLPVTLPHGPLVQSLLRITGGPGFSTYGCGSKRVDIVDPPKWICQLLNMIRVFWYPFASLVFAAIFGKPGLTCMALPWISRWKDVSWSTWAFFLVSSSRLPDLKKRNWLYMYIYIYCYIFLMFSNWLIGFQCL